MFSVFDIIFSWAIYTQRNWYAKCASLWIFYNKYIFWSIVCSWYQKNYTCKYHDIDRCSNEMYVMRSADVENMYLSHTEILLCCICFWTCQKLKVRSEKLFFCKLLVDIKLLCGVSHMIPSWVIYTQKSWYAKCALLWFLLLPAIWELEIIIQILWNCIPSDCISGLS